MGYSVTAVKYGEQTFPGPATYLHSHWYDFFDLDLFYWVLQGEGKTILVDTGMDPEHMAETNPATIATFGDRCAFRMDPADRIENKLKAVGIGLADVDYVILTHFHIDHAFNVPKFPRATFIASRKGWINITAPKYPQMVSVAGYPRVAWHYLTTEAWGRLRLVEDGEVLPGIRVFWTGGHSLCHQAVVVEGTRGKVVLPGDIVPTYRHIEENIPVGFCYDVIGVLDAMARIREEGGILVASHDPKVLQRFPGGKVC